MSPNTLFSGMPLNPTQPDLADNAEDVKDFTDIRKSYLSEKPPSALEHFPVHSIDHQPQRTCMSCTSRLTPRSATDNTIVNQSPVAFPDTRVKDLLKAVDENLSSPGCQYQEKDNSAFLIMEAPQLSPLPRLRQVALRDPILKKISWMGLPPRQPNGPTPFFLNGSRTPIFPMTQQQTLMMRSLRQPKDKSKDFLKRDKTKRHFVQLKHMPRDTDLNLPVLSPPYQTRSGKKSEVLRLDFA